MGVQPDMRSVTGRLANPSLALIEPIFSTVTSQQPKEATGVRYRGDSHTFLLENLYGVKAHVDAGGLGGLLTTV